jgi:hypothetical protein
MTAVGVPGPIPGPQTSPPERQKDLNCETFWKLMDRWHVTTDQALNLIGRNPEPMTATGRPRFPLSDEQAKIVSCLLEIELTLAVAAAGRVPSRVTVPLASMGRCDPSRAAMVLWSLNRTGNARSRPHSRGRL